MSRRDVGDDALHQQPAVGGAPGMGPLPHPSGDAVRAHQPDLDVGRLVRMKPVVERVVPLTVVWMDGVLPGLLLVRAGRQGPQQRLHAGADEGVADVALVRQVLELVDVHAGGGRDPAQHIGGGEHFRHREIGNRIWFRHGKIRSGA